MSIRTILVTLALFVASSLHAIGTGGGFKWSYTGDKEYDSALVVWMPAITGSAENLGNKRTAIIDSLKNSVAFSNLKTQCGAMIGMATYAVGVVENPSSEAVSFSHELVTFATSKFPYFSVFVKVDEDGRILEYAVTAVSSVQKNNLASVTDGEEGLGADSTVRSENVVFSITAAEGVAVEWSADGGATWTAYAKGANAPAGEISIRLTSAEGVAKVVTREFTWADWQIDVSDVQISKTVPAAKYSDRFDGDRKLPSTKLGGVALPYASSDWATNPQFVSVRGESDNKAVVIASDCKPYASSVVEASDDVSFLTVAKMPRVTTRARVIAYAGNTKDTGLFLDYNDKKVRLVDRASLRVIAEYADKDVERQFHSYLVTFNNGTKAVQFFVDGVKIEPKSSETIGSHPGKGYQLGAIFGGATLTVDGIQTDKGYDIEVDEIAIWNADVSEVAAEIARKFPAWPEVVYATTKDFTRFVLKDGEETQLKEGDTIICDTNAHYAAGGYNLWEGGPNLSAFAAYPVILRQRMDFGAGAGIPANGRVEIDFTETTPREGVYLYGDIGENARVGGTGTLCLGHTGNACTINDGVEISANVAFQAPTRTVTVKGAVEITGVVDATFGLFKLADGAELTVAKLGDGKVETDVAGKKVVYAGGKYRLVPIVTVSLDAQGGTGGTSNVTATCGSALPEIDLPTREGYVFGGYYTSALGGKRYYTFEGNGKVWDQTQGATLYAHWWAEGEYRPTQIHNGDFTKVPWMDYDFKGTRWTLANHDHTYWNQENVVVGGVIIKWGNAKPEKIYFNGVDKGWNTSEIQTVSGSLIEYFCPGWCETVLNPTIPASDRYVEMNASNPAILYQDLTTQGGDVIRWSLKHAFRTNMGSNSTQAMRVEIGAPKRENGAIANAKGTGEDIDPEIDPDTKAIYRSSGVTDASGGESAIGCAGDDIAKLSLGKSEANGWWSASGVYVIPEGQTVTRFGFISETQTGNGNLLDDIEFSTLLGNLHFMEHGDGSATIFGYWGDEDTTKRLAVKIGERLIYLNMGDYVNQNFSIVLSAEQVGGQREMSAYHEDYPSAARTLHFSPFYVFDANGGVFADGATSVRWPEKTGEACSLPEYPARAEYSATGWFTEAEGGTEVTRETKVGDAQLTLYAHWEKALREVVASGDVKVKVDAEWLKGKGLSGKTDEEIEEALEKTDERTRMKVWQTYVLNDTTEPSVISNSTEKAGKEGDVGLSVPSYTVNEKSGVTVRRQLILKREVDGATEKAADVDLNMKLIDVPLADTSEAKPIAFYTLVMTFRNDGADGVESNMSNTAGLLLAKAVGSQGRELVSVPWKGLDGGDPTLDEFLITDNMTEGDKVFIYRKGTKDYAAYRLNAEKKWEAAVTVKATKEGVASSLAAEPETVRVPVGSAVWVERKDKTAPCYFLGSPFTGEVDFRLEEGYNLCSVPGYSTFKLADIKESGVGDRVILLCVDGEPKVFAKDADGWSLMKNETTVIGGETVVVPTKVTDQDLMAIPPGAGFWYEKKGSEP